MAELPEIVRQRLGQQADGDHPDADLLTAFAEGALGERERSRVLSHLGACSVCREVVSLALPETPALQPAPAPAKSGWLRWPVLRWGAMAAAVVIVAAAVMLRQTQRAPVVDGGSASTARHDETAPAQPQFQDEEARTDTKDTLVAKEKDNVVAKAKTSAPKPLGRGGMKVAEAESRKKDEALAVRQPPLVDQVQANTELAEVQQRRAPAATQESAQQAGRASQQAFQTDVLAGSVEQKRQLSMEQAAPESRRAQAAAPLAAPQGTLQDNSQRAQQNMIAADRAEAAPPAAPVVVGGPVSATNSAVVMKSSLARVSPPRWRISSDGKLERSLDTGATWRVVAVRDGASLRTVSAIENDVWAGGTAGALYHSADGGQKWARVVVRSGGIALTTDITRVEFTDALHGFVTTASGETWVTADGGRTWNARPR